ncbi:MAG: hypothetical protein ACRCZO_00295, partial [Cetobacterium sp.]
QITKKRKKNIKQNQLEVVCICVCICKNKNKGIPAGAEAPNDWDQCRVWFHKSTLPRAHTPVHSNHTIKHSRCTPHTMKENHHHKEEDQTTRGTPAPAINQKENK